ncbi:MAG: DNA cytosine methyltransferase [Alphaproteobacteria bacterium]|nr:DNA cytosine methyltransferase [Alphaproteobacteria bacterium SS10]
MGERMIVWSICSGIDAAATAWHPLGWQTVLQCEIEAFPREVLKHRYGASETGGNGPRLYGDFNDLTVDQIAADGIPWPDIIVAGTPCQAFSVAGARRSLDDDRGNLTLKFVEFCDHVRNRSGRDPIIIWENVPGVLNTKDNAFGCFLGGLAGEDCALEPPGKKWTRAGCVSGPERSIAWRQIDAQFFGLAQRRRRVFVVASSGTIDPAQILFEFEGGRRDTAPRRETGQDVTGTLTARTKGGGGLGTDLDLAGGVQVAYGGNRTSGPRDVASSLTAHGSGTGRLDFETDTFIAQSVTGDIAPTVTAANNGKQSSEDGTGRTPAVVAFRTTGNDGAYPTGDQVGSLTTGTDRNAQLVAYPLLEVGKRTGKSTDDKRAGLGVGAATDPMYTLQAGAQHGVGTAIGVRRLTPRECERLMGFPDDFTQIPYRNKAADNCPDGPRYKALGNSKAVTVVRWIGERIAKAVAP